MRVSVVLSFLGLALADRRDQTVDPSCSDIELNEACSDVCAEETLKCVTNCDSTDSECISTCLRTEVACLDQCPCGAECPAGCQGCGNPICMKEAVLFLSTYWADGPVDPYTPMVIDFQGNVDDDIAFTFEKDTEVFGSCAATLNGEFWVIGGQKKKRQISKVQNCKLSRVGELDYDFMYGACNTFSFGILLCFSDKSSTRQACHSFDGIDIKAESSSNYPHSRTTALGVYKGQPFVTGSHHNTSNKKTEILDYASKKWNIGADYPFNTGDRISYYATASSEESVYIIGGNTADGSTNYSTSIIAEYKNDEWYHVGNVKQSRYAHGAITSGLLTMVIGGNYQGGGLLHTEIWEIETPKNRVIAPELPSGLFRDGGLFLVDKDYCKKN